MERISVFPYGQIQSQNGQIQSQKRSCPFLLPNVFLKLLVKYFRLIIWIHFWKAESIPAGRKVNRGLYPFGKPVLIRLLRSAGSLKAKGTSKGFSKAQNEHKKGAHSGHRLHTGTSAIPVPSLAGTLLFIEAFRIILTDSQKGTGSIARLFPLFRITEKRKDSAAAGRDLQRNAMSEFLRKYWFVTLIAIAFIGVLVYFVIDLNKDNVNSRKVDGQDVVASLNFGDITSTDLYDELSSNSSNVLYNMYRNAVVDQSVEADSEMKANAKQIAKNIENNMKSDSTGKTRQSILQTLASYGFTGDDAPYNYAMTAEKIRKLDADYLKEHFDELSMFVPESGRTISIITMQVPNADVLSDASQEKKDNIQKALDEGKDFAEVAKEYSDRDNTKDGGFYGYIDENTTDLDSNVLSAAKSLSKGGVSDWITVQPDGMEMVTLYKVYVNETDPKAMMDSGDEDVIEAIVTSLTGSVNGLEAAAVEDAASKLDITYEDDSVKEKMEKSIKEQLDAFESAKTTKKAEVESAAKESSEQSSAASSEKKTQEGE